MSRGRVELTSPDPAAPLDIDHAHLADPPISRRSATASSSSTSSSWRRRWPTGDADPRTDAALAAAGRVAGQVRAQVGTTFHPSRDMPDGAGRRPERRSSITTVAVHGVAGLRVADASIFPTIPRANLHCTIVAVAEKLADAMGAG